MVIISQRQNNRRSLARNKKSRSHENHDFKLADFELLIVVDLVNQ
jgi:hypothetical protein